MKDPKNPWNCLCKAGEQHSPYPFTEGLSYARKEERPPWPESDPAPEVTTLDPIPVKKPRAVALFAAEYPFVRIGYSRVLLRGVTLGTYRRVEMWSLWFPPEMQPRPFARYERFADAKETVRWDGSTFAPFVPATGEPGTWKWSRVRYGSEEIGFTELKKRLKEAL